MNMLRAINGALAIGDDDYVTRFVFDTYEVVESETVDTLRWSIVRRDIVTDGTDFVELTYNVPATEYQECDLDMRARAVQPKQVVTTIYV